MKKTTPCDRFFCFFLLDFEEVFSFCRKNVSTFFFYHNNERKKKKIVLFNGGNTILDL